jgi:hypothetical protein
MTHIEDHEQGSERTGGYSGNLQAVLKFDDQLVALRDKIPSHLRRVKTCMPELEHMDEESIIFHRQSVVLYLRCAHRAYFFPCHSQDLPIQPHITVSTDTYKPAYFYFGQSS